MDSWVIVIVTLIFSAFFSGMEIAFVSSNNLKVEIDKGKGLVSARIISFFNRKPSWFIGALLIGNNIALVIYGIAMAIILEPAIIRALPESWNREFVILIIQTILATMLILFVAEFIPKAFFRINPNHLLNIFAVPVFIFYIILYPFIYLFIGLGELMLRIFSRMKDSGHEYVFSGVDLDNYVKEFSPDKQEHAAARQEIQMFQNAIDFRNIKLRECMVPRTEIEAIEKDESPAEIRKKFIETGFSRILIYKESIDNIIGYVHSLDMFKSPQDLESITRSMIYVPETMLANNVLSMFIKQHKSIAVVVDEFGGTSGIVTMEDIIEEIFGEIEDEYDEEDLIEKVLDDGEYIFSGRTEIDYLNEKYDLDLPESEDYETLAGLIIHYRESIPEPNEKVDTGKFIFTVKQVSENRIELVHVKIT